MVDQNFVNALIASNPSYQAMANYLGISMSVLLVIIAIISIWSLIWKGLALWKAAGKKQLVWFIIILVVNTIGILEILYIYVFSKIEWDKKPEPRREKSGKTTKRRKK